MNRKFAVLLTLLVFLTVFAGIANSQISVELSNRSAGEYMAAERYPIIFTGEGLIKGAGSQYITEWSQIGYSPDANENDNRNIALFNPDVFTIGLKLGVYNEGDSAKISTAYLESCYNTSSYEFWNGDTSNLFISEGSYNHDLYGSWRFEALSDTSRYWLFPLRALIGGYVRFIFETDLEDTVSVKWTLVCER